jgi:hypothetical protein
MCYIRFGAYRNHMYITIIVKNNLLKKEKKKETKEGHRQGIMLELADLMPDCWLELSLHLESPVTGQLDQGFPWFSLVPKQMLSWYPDSKLHCMRPMQPSHW